MTKPGDEAGFATVQLVAVAGLSLVVVAALSNVLVLGYARAAVRMALDEGVRAGSRSPAPALTCHAVAVRTLDDLLGGDLGSGIDVHACHLEDDILTATADVRLRAWSPGIPDSAYTATAQGQLEVVRDDDAEGAP